MKTDPKNRPGEPGEPAQLRGIDPPGRVLITYLNTTLRICPPVPTVLWRNTRTLVYPQTLHAIPAFQTRCCCPLPHHGSPRPASVRPTCSSVLQGLSPALQPCWCHLCLGFLNMLLPFSCQSLSKEQLIIGWLPILHISVLPAARPVRRTESSSRASPPPSSSSWRCARRTP